MNVSAKTFKVSNLIEIQRKISRKECAIRLFINIILVHVTLFYKVILGEGRTIRFFASMSMYVLFCRLFLTFHQPNYHSFVFNKPWRLTIVKQLSPNRVTIVI